MEKPLSESALNVKASTTITIDALYKKMKSEGADVIGFGAGEPDFPTPAHIKDAAIAAIHADKTRYTPAAGTLSLREAVCARVKADCGVDYSPRQIVVSSGAKHSIYLALRALTNPGDEIILPAPYWVTYEEAVKMTGGVPAVLKTGYVTNFKITAEQLKYAITRKTKALILNSPSNPSGQVYSREELAALTRVCAENDVYIISDEIYGDLVYGAEFVSVPSLGEDVKALTILINGVSKSYAMTGWRVGWAAAPLKIAEVMANCQSHSASAPSSISQEAAEAALRGGRECVETMRAAFERRRDMFLEIAAKIPGVRFLKPDGAFYVMLDISSAFGKKSGGSLMRNADDFAKNLLEKSLVAVVPCTGFGERRCIRLSYAVGEEVIAEGLRRLDAFMRDLA